MEDGDEEIEGQEGIQSPQDFKRKGKGQGIGDLLSTDAQQSRGKEAPFTINAQIQMPLTSLVLFSFPR